MKVTAQVSITRLFIAGILPVISFVLQTIATRGIDDDIAVLGFNRYLVDPSQAAPEDLVTEVCVPLA